MKDKINDKIFQAGWKEVVTTLKGQSEVNLTKREEDYQEERDEVYRQYEAKKKRKALKSKKKQQQPDEYLRLKG